MSFQINLDPFSTIPYFTLQEHSRRYPGPGKFDELMHNLEDSLRDFIKISSEYRFYLISKSAKEGFITDGRITFLDNPYKGTVELLSGKGLSTGKDIIDISYSFPQCATQDLSSFEMVICDPAASLGVPGNFLFVFSKDDAIDASLIQELKQVSDLEKEIYVLSGVLDDLIEKQTETLLRESNYKAAVLYQLIDSHPALSSRVSKEIRSKSVITAQCEPQFADRIEMLGYRFYREENGSQTTIAIANYATLSKELIEMFADRVSEL